MLLTGYGNKRASFSWLVEFKIGTLPKTRAESARQLGMGGSRIYIYSYIYIFLCTGIHIYIVTYTYFYVQVYTYIYIYNYT